MRPYSPKEQINIVRVGLYMLFVGYSFLAFGGLLNHAPRYFSLSLGTVTLVVAVLAGLVLVMTLSYAAGFAAFLGALATAVVYSPPLMVFSSYVAISLVFTEGLSCLQPYHMVADQVIEGPNETVTVNLLSSLRRVWRTMAVVSTSLVGISLGYSVLPDILPVVSDTATLAFYATISMIAIAVTALYLGQRK